VTRFIGSDQSESDEDRMNAVTTNGDEQPGLAAWSTSWCDRMQAHAAAAGHDLTDIQHRIDELATEMWNLAPAEAPRSPPGTGS